MGTVNRTVFGCPSCGARVSGHELACPRCGAVFRKDTRFECPFCGVMVPRDSSTCPSCGIDLHLPEEKSVEATLDELFDQVIEAEKQRAQASNKRFGCPKCSFLVTGAEDKCPKCSYEFSKVNQVECPICGALIPSSAKKCPECDRALLSLDDLAQMVRDEPEEPAEKLTVEDIVIPPLAGEATPAAAVASTEIPPPPPDQNEIDFALCPVCGKDSPVDATSCPHCKTEFVSASDESEAPEQKHAADEAATALDSLLEVAKNGSGRRRRKLRPSKAATTKAPTLVDREGAGRLGRVNGTGFVNGKRHGSGVVNGTGLVNGSGAINGLGATNGVSLVNGKGISNGLGVNGRGRKTARSRRDIIMQWRILAALMALIIVIPAFFFIGTLSPSEEYQIDGDFDDWAHVQSYPVQRASSSPTINIQEWSAVFSENDLFYYVRTQSNVMSGPLVESLCLFVDTDASSSTGYSLGSIGAEYRVILEGWNGTVRSSTVSYYDSSEDLGDWNCWTSESSSECAIDGNEIEGRAWIDDVSSTIPRVLVVTKDEVENLCFSAPVPLGGTLLVVEQSPTPEIATTGLVGLESSVEFLSLKMTAVGGPGTVSGITPAVTGCELASTFASSQMDAGDVATFDYRVDTLGGSATQLVSVIVSEDDIQSDFDCVLVCGAGARAYLLQPPDNVTIDGAFADWEGRTSMDSDLIPVLTANIDIVETGASNTTESAFFFVSVRGEICCGAYIPSVCAKPVPGGGVVLVPTRKTAEDITRVYIDVDMSASTGLGISYLSKSIGADRMLEVRGVFGRITSSVMFTYQSGSWVNSGAHVEAANDETRLELGVSISSLGSSDEIDFIFETTSWNGRSDVAAFDPSALTAFMTSGDFMGTRAWPIDDSVLPTTASAMSYQRKLFYDGTNFWSLYFDGTDTVHKYSSDGGATWTDAGTVFTTSAVKGVSVWYDAANNIVYAVGDTSTASANLYVQRGTVNPGSHTITWAASDSTCSLSANTHASKLAYISKDANGYIWIIGTNKTANSPAKWDMTALKSTSTDSVSSWTWTGNMLGTDKNDDYLYATILSAGSGSDMWAVYNYDQRVSSREYTSGTWSAETTIYNGAGGALNFIQVAPVSSVVDDDGTIHVVYGDSTKDASGNSLPNICYTYYTGTAWATPVVIDEASDSIGNKCPTVSLDTGTGDLYAFWIQMNNNNIICKQLASETWSFVDIGTQSSYSKSYLTSVYAVSGQNNICYMWTQNTSSPIEVMFDKIPEFEDILIPICFMILAVVSLSRSRTRRARKD